MRRKYKCRYCGFVYREEIGYLEENIQANTDWNQVPDDWVCPVCGVSKSAFELII